MHRLVRFSFLSAFGFLVMGYGLGATCLAQAPGAQSAPGAAPDGARQPTTQPSGTNRTNRPSPFPDTTARPLFLSGSVRVADGTPPGEKVLIERVCNGRSRPEGYTDSKGNFSFLVGGQPGSVFADASTAAPSGGFGLDGGLQNNVNPRDLNGCEIRASLAGFQSTSIVLTSGKLLDAPNIGVLFLHRLASFDDSIVNVTTASAPKDARNAYEKGLDNARKQKWPEAERDLLKAVQVYPRYAVAWYELGRVYQQEKKVDDAERALKEAIRIDPGFVNPHGQLAFLAAVRSKWDDVIVHSSEVMKLSDTVPADTYFYSAVAHYNLQKIDVARTHARQAATLDTQNRNPRIHHLLGVILAQAKEYDEAEEELNLYLRLVPNAPEAEAVRQKLGEIGRIGDREP